MSELTTILTQATPLGVVALSLFIILQLVRQKKEITNLRDNHLHEVKDGMERIEVILNRQTEMLQNIYTGIEILKIKLNGRDK
ncbi:hypothetical protein M1295_01470 [Patescibacteria group bacterium]|nr:hypothetical protein [Patescibacteria group bacterium]